MQFDPNLLKEKHVEGVLDSLKFNSTFKYLIFSAWLGYLFMAFNNNLLGYCMPMMTEELGIDSITKGYIFSALLWGGVLGKFVWGLIADKKGRKFAFNGSLLTFATFTGLLAFAFNPIYVLVVRVIAGFGSTGFVPVDLTMISEYSPTKIRGRLTGSVSLLSSVGVVVGVGSSLVLLPVIGWRAMFLLGLIPVIAAWIVWKKVPESPRWLVNNNRKEEAVQALKRLGGSEEQVKEQIDANIAPSRKIEAMEGLSTLFTKYPKPFFLGWILWLSTLFAYMSMAVWLPTIFMDVFHFSLNTSLKYTLAASVCGLLGRFLGVYLIEKIGRRPSITSGLIMTGLSLILFGYTKNPSVLLVVAMSLYFFYDGVSVCIMAYVPELFPTSVRLKANALCAATAQLVAATSPILAGYLMNANQFQAIFWVYAATLLIPMLVFLIMGKETKGKGLEELTNNTDMISSPKIA